MIKLLLSLMIDRFVVSYSTKICLEPKNYQVLLHQVLLILSLGMEKLLYNRNLQHPISIFCLSTPALVCFTVVQGILKFSP